ncbi:UvrD-helicase domain-containing protein [Gordonia alkanivorans]|uniref:DNA 3'-5' helicase n=1 Tax=Gordonia alkanivorans CGMCC 6845 TaxID=1423140 RepID=W9D955_9ACTN|nr:UvrD-helicase domain-containing protein [Gordonia alkanivorans]ETA04872.1 ATP-dependent DNA helicase [Gordonia alkanivorans CGMCC 6845]MDH3026042.1 UvrD-helicase domain-containing protein [Gordonia alkanivorans]MDH3051285.1 UvrD-helicase domain-containing protein [Gordonia alkanivorans]
MTAAPLADQAARDRITTDTDATLFVEAGAGSGKTHSLVGRICHLVLDDGIELDAIAAITFTEKAAAELRERVRVELATHDTDRARAALEQIDTAAIGTLHAFAARIIGEHPLEAGVPPRIAVVDAMGSQLSFERRWRRMRTRLFTDDAPPMLVDAMGIVMAAGASLDQMRTLADALDRNWDRLTLDDNPQGIAPADIDRILWETDAIIDKLDDCLDPEDKLAVKLEELREWRILVAAERDSFGWVPMVDLCPKLGNVGRGSAWRGGVAQCKEIKAAAKALREEICSDVVGTYVDGAVRVVVRHLSEIVLDEARERQRSGQLEFHDLLVLARDVLGKPEVAAAAHRRYQRVLLDEFQDTDPLQLTLAQRIVAGRDESGRLFTVGDPKQSIYRFRRADIAAYMSARDRTPPADVVQLTTNFRSTRPVLDWVNAVFGRLIVAEHHVQPEYTPLDPAPARPRWDLSWGPKPFVFPDTEEPVDDEDALSPAEALRARESRDVARIIATAIENGWRKETFDGDAYEHVPLRWKDICILIPSRAVLPFLEKSLDAAGIEFRSEASSLVYSTQEVHDLLVTCRALANTADEAALVAALRTPLFGCGDDDLLRWKAADGRRSIYADAPTTELAESPVAAACAYLKALSSELGDLNPGALLSRLATDRRVFEVSMDSPRHRDVWRRLRFVIDQARAWYAEDRGSLRDYIDWAATQADENARVAETVLPEIGVDAVRIMTIHAAKGLQFPMVVVAGMSGGFRTQPEPLLWDEDEKLQACASKNVASKGYAAAAKTEKAHAEAEKKRLLYVACTRAESHLAVSGYVGKNASWGAALAPALEGLPNDVPELVEPVRRDDEAIAQHERQAWVDWSAETAAIETASTIRVSYSATRIVHGGDDAEDVVLQSYRDAGLLTVLEPDQVPAGTASPDSGATLGTALHALLEQVALGTAVDDEFDEIARRAAALAGVVDVDHFVALARSALQSAPVQRAAVREHWKEMQLAGPGPDGATVVEGIADLVYRDDDGSLVIVDYKTDVGVSAETLEAYWAQLAIYADLLRNATGEKVSRLQLVFCRPGQAAVVERALRPADR